MKNTRCDICGKPPSECKCPGGAYVTDTATDAQKLVNSLLLELEDMTPDARLEALEPITDRFCKYCGGTGGNSCQCWNDE